jgi:hypothetical protein
VDSAPYRGVGAARSPLACNPQHQGGGQRGPAASYPPGIVQRIIRHEPLRLAIGDRHTLAKATSVELSRLAGDRLENCGRALTRPQ